ncbi:hypothetical protein BASA50_002942 [Batrachochytrium salamandrivorans]|uniref:3-keto-steroid reductase n=1 Tax=Batrachochytrium salamandrivorans TaxID=1357716 RepID=A0ABQ8FJZ1_9FUNG|nr:hypothetical protein BASA60_010163 [Batrachochytrium salamandrivorans]KAH6599600.1 hypothetical protein BASA50_002942 [Batrachochytrium salamandrivorans]
MAPTNPPSDSIVALITGANRNKQKAIDAQEQLIAKHFDNAADGQQFVQLLLVDLSNTGSVFAACAEIKSRFHHIDFLILNAGIMPISHTSFSGGAKDLFTRPATLAKTGGDSLVQRMGTVTSEGLGEVFAANVFGHYIMVRELEDTMAASKDARIVWMSSTTANPTMMSFEDFQCIKGNYPYESSKRLGELISLEMGPYLAERGIHSFIASPGIVNSGITQGAISSWMVFGVMIILRLLGLSGINITGKNGATSTLFLATSENPKSIDSTKVFHSEITRFGHRSVEMLSIDSGDALARQNLLVELEALRSKFHALAVKNGYLKA